MVVEPKLEASLGLELPVLLQEQEAKLIYQTGWAGEVVN